MAVTARPLCRSCRPRERHNAAVVSRRQQHAPAGGRRQRREPAAEPRDLAHERAALEALQAPVGRARDHAAAAVATAGRQSVLRLLLPGRHAAAAANSATAAAGRPHN